MPWETFFDTDRALHFIQVVKKQMKKEGQRGKDRYIRLLKLLIDLRDQHPNESADPTLQHIRRLLSGYPCLIAELNAFLPEFCKLDLPNNQSSDPKPTSSTLDFLRTVGDRLSEEQFKRFLVLIAQPWKTVSPDDINEIRKLLSDHADYLIQHFEQLVKHVGSSEHHAEKVDHQQVKHVMGTMINSAVQSEGIQKQKQHGMFGSKAGGNNIEGDHDGNSTTREHMSFNCDVLEDRMFELDMRCEWYSQLHREIKKFLEEKKNFESGLSSELIQLEDYLCPRSIRCMKDLFGGSRDDVMEYLKNEKGVESTLSLVLRHLEEQQMERALFVERARWLWDRELSKSRQSSQERKLQVLKRKRCGNN